jgi:hypothetical protein
VAKFIAKIKPLGFNCGIYSQSITMVHEQMKNGLGEAEWHCFPVRDQKKNIIASDEVKLESRVLVCVYCKVYKWIFGNTRIAEQDKKNITTFIITGVRQNVDVGSDEDQEILVRYFGRVSYFVLKLS